MKQEFKNLLVELKDNGEDYELYPTNSEMLNEIYRHIITKEHTFSVLDIGAGTTNFKAYLEKYNQTIKDNKSNYDKYNYFRGAVLNLKTYYAIEKSKILIDRFDKDVICLGTDIHKTTLIDKKVDIIFCNPIYSEFKEWTKKIVHESNCKYIYLVIPQRWKDDEELVKYIENNSSSHKVLANFDFLNAERSARATVDILFIDKSYTNTKYGRVSNKDLEDINYNAFGVWFDETFPMRDRENIHEAEANKVYTNDKEKIKNKLVSSDSKAKMLVEMYNKEMETLVNHLKSITTIPEDVLQTFGVSKASIKGALIQKIKCLKTLYWEMVFEQMSEVTERLTSTTRKEMLSKFTNLLTVDFTIENIYPLIVWVLKNAKDYYNGQLLDFFKKLSAPDNVKMYKSNQKVFARDEWRHNSWHYEERPSHYTLEYRIICSSLFKSNYNGSLDNWDNGKFIDDVCVIANNLGFKVGDKQVPEKTGKPYFVYLENGEVLFEYKVYLNGNTHIRFNKEFAKAMNVECSRLLGWIRTAEDIKKEFPDDLAKGAEKYFKVNDVISLSSNTTLMLTMS